jgi:hypothetical protein
VAFFDSLITWRFAVDEIVISKRTLFIALMLSVLIVLLVITIPRVLNPEEVSAVERTIPMPSLQDNAIESESEEGSDAMKAAIFGARAFYTVDFQKGQETWLDQLCAVSTKTGCIVYQNVIGPSLWASFNDAKTVSTVEVTAKNKVQEQLAPSRGNALTQIWRLQIKLSDPWPMQSEPITTFEALTLVIKEQEKWEFERFLTEKEAAALSQGGLP